MRPSWSGSGTGERRLPLMTTQGIGFVRRPRIRAGLALAIGTALMFSSGAAASAAPAEDSQTAKAVKPGAQPSGKLPELYKDGRYIVMLAADPLATYDGGVAGLPATKPAEGERLDDESPNAVKYRRHLEREQQQLAQSEGVK